MADFQDVNVGAAPDDGTGDPLRTAFTTINTNFDRATASDYAEDITASWTFYGDINLYHNSSGNTGTIAIDNNSFQFVHSTEPAMDTQFEFYNAKNLFVTTKDGYSLTIAPESGATNFYSSSNKYGFYGDSGPAEIWINGTISNNDEASLGSIYLSGGFDMANQTTSSWGASFACENSGLNYYVNANLPGWNFWGNDKRIYVEGTIEGGTIEGGTFQGSTYQGSTFQGTTIAASTTMTLAGSNVLTEASMSQALASFAGVEHDKPSLIYWDGDEFRAVTINDLKVILDNT